MGGRRAWLALGLIVALAGGSATAGGPAFDVPAAQTVVINNAAALAQAAASSDRVKIIVQLTDPPVAARFRPAAGARVDAASAAAQSYQQTLGDRQTTFVTSLRSAVPDAQVAERFSIVFNGMAVVLSGRGIPVVQRLAGVRSVTISRRFHPLMNVSNPLIGAAALRSDLTGASRGGGGVMVGIIDTGIDIRNNFFKDAGYTNPVGYPKTDTTGNLAYVNKKVIVARSYPDAGFADSARDTIGHGSHVAGTVAGNSSTSAKVNGVMFSLTGLAPRAYLGNYNVFPDGAESSSDAQIVDAIDDAVADGMDVLNMSLGGTILTPTNLDPIVIATNTAVDAGVIVAVAAGNSGPGAGTVSSPGNAEKAITAGASTNPHFVGQPVDVTAPSGVPSKLQNVGAATGDFSVFTSTTAALYVWWGAIAGNDLACDAVAGTPLTGKLALISRGSCTFTTKVRNAQNAGAIGVLIFNNVAGDPVGMAHDATDPKPTIPAVMVSNESGIGMRDWYQGHPGTAAARIDPDFAEFVTKNADIIAGFSSRGPTTFDNHIKPDVTAPGVNVLSSINGPGLFAFFQGTSMASPHVAGAAALLRAKFPTWSPQQIKSALMSTAKKPVWDHVSGTVETSVMVRGAGRIDLALARNPRATFDPSSINFGSVTPSSSRVRAVLIVGVSGGGSWTVDVKGPERPDGSATSDVKIRLSTKSVTLGAGSTLILNVTAEAGPTALGQYEGQLTLKGTTTLRIPFWLYVGAP
jgi:subtilisin family serine protease